MINPAGVEEQKSVELFKEYLNDNADAIITDTPSEEIQPFSHPPMERQEMEEEIGSIERKMQDHPFLQKIGHWPVNVQNFIKFIRTVREESKDVFLDTDPYNGDFLEKGTVTRNIFFATPEAIGTTAESYNNKLKRLLETTQWISQYGDGEQRAKARDWIEKIEAFMLQMEGVMDATLRYVGKPEETLPLSSLFETLIRPSPWQLDSSAGVNTIKAKREQQLIILNEFPHIQTMYLGASAFPDIFKFIVDIDRAMRSGASMAVNLSNQNPNPKTKKIDLSKIEGFTPTIEKPSEVRIEPARIRDFLGLEQGKADKAMTRGGIDLSQQDAALHVTKDANGGVRVDVDPALITRIEREGMSEVDPVIINMQPADIQSLFGVKGPVLAR